MSAKELGRFAKRFHLRPSATSAVQNPEQSFQLRMARMARMDRYPVKPEKSCGSCQNMDRNPVHPVNPVILSKDRRSAPGNLNLQIFGPSWGSAFPGGERWRDDFHGFLLGSPSPSSGVNFKKTTSLPSRRIAHRKLLRASAPLRENTAVRSGVCVPFAPLAPFALIGSMDLVAALRPSAALCGSCLPRPGLGETIPMAESSNPVNPEQPFQLRMAQIARMDRMDRNPVNPVQRIEDRRGAAGLSRGSLLI
jgi:hypothetical protein